MVAFRGWGFRVQELRLRLGLGVPVFESKGVQFLLTTGLTHASLLRLSPG